MPVLNDSRCHAHRYIQPAAVNQAPVANSDSYSVAEDGTLTVSAPGVLINDADANPGTTLSVATPRPVAPTTHGLLTLNANGSFTYVPDPNYNGPDCVHIPS